MPGQKQCRRLLLVALKTERFDRQAACRGQQQNEQLPGLSKRSGPLLRLLRRIARALNNWARYYLRLQRLGICLNSTRCSGFNDKIFCPIAQSIEGILSFF